MEGGWGVGNNNPCVTVVGTKNAPMANQSPSITSSIYRAPHTTRCGKLEDTNRRYISKHLLPMISQTPDDKPTFQ